MNWRERHEKARREGWMTFEELMMKVDIEDKLVGQDE